jgi:hypothetical protein
VTLSLWQTGTVSVINSIVVRSTSRSSGKRGRISSGSSGSRTPAASTSCASSHNVVLPNFILVMHSSSGASGTPIIFTPALRCRALSLLIISSCASRDTPAVRRSADLLRIVSSGSVDR